jgi:hypothetical protein
MFGMLASFPWLRDDYLMMHCMNTVPFLHNFGSPSCIDPTPPASQWVAMQERMKKMEQFMQRQQLARTTA